MINSSFRAIERLPLISYPLLNPKRLFVKLFRVSFQSSSDQRRFGGAQFVSMAQSTKQLQMGVGCKPGFILPSSDEHVLEAIDAIKAGNVIAVPTDTLYGFACDACSAEAVNRIYEIKGRKLTSPLAICVADVADIPRFAIADHLPIGLLDQLLPGPVTVILKRGSSSVLEKSLNPGLESIGVRVPDFDFIRSVARGSQSALALTSANLSGQPSSVSIRDFEELWPQCSLVYDGGTLPAGRAGSTVVDLVNPGLYKILRDGSAREETTAILQNFGLKEAM
ncbi:DHBP synthase RibB-like alpha/beta domain-containing protein isoform X1 [Carex rostrata]